MVKRRARYLVIETSELQGELGRHLILDANNLRFLVGEDRNTSKWAEVQHLCFKIFEDSPCQA